MDIKGFSSTFRYLTDADRRRLFDARERSQFASGQVIVEEDKQLPGIFLIRCGEVTVEKRGIYNEIEIARLLEGELFGELSYVDEGAFSSATLVADGNVEIDLFPRSEIEKLMDEDPGFAGRFFRSLAQVMAIRLRVMNLKSVGMLSL